MISIPLFTHLQGLHHRPFKSVSLPSIMSITGTRSVKMSSISWAISFLQRMASPIVGQWQSSSPSSLFKTFNNGTLQIHWEGRTSAFRPSSPLLSLSPTSSPLTGLETSSMSLSSGGIFVDFFRRFGVSSSGELSSSEVSACHFWVCAIFLLWVDFLCHVYLFGGTFLALVLSLVEFFDGAMEVGNLSGCTTPCVGVIYLFGWICFNSAPQCSQPF